MRERNCVIEGFNLEAGGSVIKSGNSVNDPEGKLMNVFRRALLTSSGFTVAILSGSIAAQGLDQLKDITGGSGLGGAASSLGSLSTITSGSAANAAGVIDYCVKNNYLSGGSASSVKDQLMKKITGADEPAESNPDYISGARGIVTGGSGQSVDLSMAGLKSEAVKKACEKILDQAKSML